MVSTNESMIIACEWASSRFLILSENVFSPLLYYSYFGAAIPSILIAFFVFFKGPKKLANQLLLLTILSFVVWIFGALVTWATEIPAYTMMAWSILILFEPLIYFFAFYFVYAFIFEKDFSLKQKLLFGLPLIVSIILAPTHFGLLGYDLSNCDRAAVEGIVATYGYVIEIVYLFLILGFAITFINKTKDHIQRKKAILLTTGTVAFLLSFSLGNILEVFTENWYIGQYGLFGAPIFVAFLAYIMVKYKTFNTKLIGTQALVIALLILVASMLFVRKIENIRYVIAFTVILLIPFGVQLVRSVRREIEQREKIELLAKELEKSNEHQTELINFITHQVKGFFTKSKLVFGMIANGELGPVPPDVKTYAERGLASDTTGVEMVQEILENSNLKSGEIAYHMERLDLNPLVQSVISDLMPVAKEKGLQFTVQIPTENISIQGDRFQLKQVFKNIIDNAIRYTPQGSITINLSKTPEGKALFTCTDSGVGLAKDDYEHLFTQGGRGARSLAVNVNSTGYGLYIVKTIVGAHKGRVWALSDGEGKGSRFYVELPTS